MTDSTKIKAEELTNKFSIINKELAKKCALVVVDEILKEYEEQIFRRGLKNVATESNYDYWQKVKQHILNL